MTSKRDKYRFARNPPTDDMTANAGALTENLSFTATDNMHF